MEDGAFLEVLCEAAIIQNRSRPISVHITVSTEAVSNPLLVSTQSVKAYHGEVHFAQCSPRCSCIGSWTMPCVLPVSATASDVHVGDVRTPVACSALTEYWKSATEPTNACA